ncbi:hypothetical protein [Methylobacterium terrae]|uniref:hypothetical protein n=1 Tax=Methylobacterium terrae TaxID=2202827 RepID=UPI0013A5619D|nr:hypothetical protein [Methylobacterium terrae]
MVDAEGASVVAAHEKRIADLETEKALLAEKVASCGKPLASFSETYRTAFDYLANSGICPGSRNRRAVLKLVFVNRLPYLRGEGYRTAKISAPIRLP